MICYMDWMEESKRWIVAQALKQVERYGLKGSDHFYITFQTTYPGVELPPELREQYPKEMQILIQDAFWNLQVKEDGFSLELLFNNVKHFIEVPFKALLNFIDPGSEFGLEFTPPSPSKEPVLGENIISFDHFRKLHKN